MQETRAKIKQTVLKQHTHTQHQDARDSHPAEVYLPFIRLLTLNPGAGCNGAGVHGTSHDLGAAVAVLELQVGLSIQVCSLDIAEVSAVGGGQEQQVCRNLGACGHLSACR